ncbi:MAG: hypothetical protein V3V21_09975 [Thermoplasmata archaeon]
MFICRHEVDRYEDVEFLKKEHRYAAVRGYLDLAKEERNPGRAWNYVNSADKILPLIVDDADIPRSLYRMAFWDKRLEELDEKARDELGKTGKRVDCMIQEREGREKTKESNPDELLVQSAYELQSQRARFWYDINSNTTLRFCLWSAFNARLLTILVASIILAEWLYHTVIRPTDPWWYLPFFTISLMGLLGGVLSTQLLTREFIEKETSAGLINVLTLTRILLGAAGALVYFLIAGSGLVAGQDISQLLHDNAFVLMSTGVVAGFSEQLFIGALDKHTRHLSIA